MLGTEFLRSDWDERDELEPGEPFYFGFAPDECHKANYSGAEQFIELPQAVADPVLHGVSGRRDVTLVEYLRISIAWGGCPGWEFSPGAPVPAALDRLINLGHHHVRAPAGLHSRRTFPEDPHG